MSTSGGTMLETLTRFTLPMPAARRALSNALSAVPPSAEPAVAATFVTFFQNIATPFLPRPRPLALAFAGSRSRARRARNVFDHTEPILKRKHFFLASLSSCSIIQAHFAPVRQDLGEEIARRSGERGSIG